MNDYCILLSPFANMDPLIDGFDITKPGKSHTTIPFELINPKLIEWLQNFDIKIIFAELRHWGPGVYSNIHVDVFEGDHVKLNWVEGGLKSKTQWFKQKENTQPEKNPTPIGTFILQYNKNDVKLVHEQNVVGPCVLQIGVPHNVVTHIDHDRWTLCFVLRFSNDKFVTMEDAKRIFGPLRRKQ